MSRAGAQAAPRPFVLAVASGKGGTGKTLAATNIAALAARNGSKVVLADCDVEAPNDHLFVPVEEASVFVAEAEVAVVDAASCTGCGACRDACAFGAVRVIGASALVFDELCHGCRACEDVCPAGAISLAGKRVGTVESGRASAVPGLTLVTGTLDIGQVKAPTVIRAARTRAAGLAADLVLVDAPPGVACSAVAAVQGADALLLVTEPTPFGVHDLELGLTLGSDLGIPMGVLVNRVGTGSADVDALCGAFGVSVVARVPFDRRIAEAYASGGLVADAVPETAGTFGSLVAAMKAIASSRRGAA